MNLSNIFIYGGKMHNSHCNGALQQNDVARENVSILYIFLLVLLVTFGRVIASFYLTRKISPSRDY